MSVLPEGAEQARPPTWVAAASGMRAARRWYAVQCQPHGERRAAANLVHQGVEVFLPMRRKTRRHARKLDTVRVPFFSGYLFVHLDVARDRWRSINGTFGVVRLVMQGETPAPAPPGIVEALMQVCGSDGVLQFHPDLKCGQAVRVLAGPFADLIGELDQLSDAGRLRVLLNIMGTNTKVFLPRESVVPADSYL